MKRTGRVYKVKLPAAEARWLSGLWGPPSLLPGSVSGDGENVRLDEQAFGLLAHWGTISDSKDGRITWRGDVPMLHVGGGSYPVWEA